MSGAFIVFEGLDGSGKSTQARLLSEGLAGLGLRASLSKEPTDRPIGALVREVLRGNVVTTPTALALLYAADREDHLNNPGYGILKSRAKGDVVISDRYYFSSYAYQGVSEDISFVRTLNASFPPPDILIFVDTPPEVCMGRIDSRGEARELFDRLDYLEKVRANFKEAFRSLPEGVRYLEVDGSRGVEDLRKEIFSFVCQEMNIASP